MPAVEDTSVVVAAEHMLHHMAGITTSDAAVQDSNSNSDARQDVGIVWVEPPAECSRGRGLA